MSQSPNAVITMDNAQDLASKFWKSKRRVKCDGHILSKKDTVRIIDCYTQWAFLIQDVLDQINPNIRARVADDRRVAEWLQSLLRLDCAYIQEQLKAFLAFMRDDYFVKRCGSWKDCRRVLKESCVDWKSEVFAYVRPIAHVYWKTGAEYDYQLLNTVIQYTTRLTLNDCDWIEESEVQKYKDFEIEIAGQSYPEDLLYELNRVVVDWFGTTSSCSRTRISTGATAEVKRNEGKANKLRDLSLTTELLGMDQLIGLDLMPLWVRTAYTENLVPSSHMFSVYQLVPKGMTKKRGISMEPTANAIYQQAVFSYMDKVFCRRPDIHVDLHDQGRNRRMALAGSKNHKFATIDLSSASDSVTYTLVERITRGTPLHDMLLACRTPLVVMPDGEQIRVEKFAGMGSACTFPVECMVFSAIVQIAQEHVGRRSNYTVYGDDIIVHETCFDEVIRLLESLHFIVNHDKSFKPAATFKESCGIEAINGVDVSPLRISRRYDACAYNNQTPSTLSGQVDMCNECYSKGYFRLRHYILSQLRPKDLGLAFSSGKHEHVFDASDIDEPKVGLSLLSSNPRNEHLRVHWNAELQVYDVSCLSTKVTYKDSSISWSDFGYTDEYYRYLITLQTLSHSCRTSLLMPDDLLEIKVGATREVFCLASCHLYDLV